MNLRPIDEARNADLRGSLPALQRAAQRARALAASTGTAFIVSRDDVVEKAPSDSIPQQTPIASAVIPTTDHLANIGDPDAEEHFQREDVEWGLKGDD